MVFYRLLILHISRFFESLSLYLEEVFVFYLRAKIENSLKKYVFSKTAA